MFIRRTKTRTTANGENYFSYCLVGTYRVRQRTLLNLGSIFACPQSQWPELTGRIEQIIQGQAVLFESAPDLESLAQSLAAILLSKIARTDLLSKPKPGTAVQSDTAVSADPRDLHTVDLDSLALMDVRTVGGEPLGPVGDSTSKTAGSAYCTGFSSLPGPCGHRVGRMVQPGSELSTFDWLQTHSVLGELVGFDDQKLSLSALYRASDRLWQQHDKIESFLYAQHHYPV